MMRVRFQSSKALDAIRSMAPQRRDRPAAAPVSANMPGRVQTGGPRPAFNARKLASARSTGGITAGAARVVG
jgi:hypothetical protein